MPVYKKLLEGTRKVSPGTIHNYSTLAKCSVKEVIYDPDSKIIRFTGTVVSSTRRGKYNCIVEFLNIEPLEGLTDEEIQQGFNPKPNLADDEIRCRCNCTSYRFRADYANRRAGAGTGSRFPTWHRLTDRKSNNPDNTPCFCKHVMEFVNYLQKQGFVH